MEEGNIADDVKTDDVIENQLKSRKLSSSVDHILSFGEVEGCKNVYDLLAEVTFLPHTLLHLFSVNWSLP